MESRLHRAPPPSTSQGAASNTTGGPPSSLFPSRLCHTVGWGWAFQPTAALTSPAPLSEVCPWDGIRSLVLGPKLYFPLYLRTIICHMPGMSPTFLIHSHGRFTWGEERIFSYKDPACPLSHGWALEPGDSGLKPSTRLPRAPTLCTLPLHPGSSLSTWKGLCSHPLSPLASLMQLTTGHLLPEAWQTSLLELKKLH